MKLHVKYMVSNCCRVVLVQVLEKLDIDYVRIELGEVTLAEKISAEQYRLLKIALKKSGFELLDDQRSILIEKIKNLVIELVHLDNQMARTPVSTFLSQRLHINYQSLSSIFSEVTGSTIEQYLIANKIERAKELLLYNEDNITEISYKLNYSSVSHLSNQFKKITGLTPSYFKKIRLAKQRIAVEDL
ncbi:MAG: AraC family transcriptional regulator [Chitinophagaceae bacterium]